MEFEVLETKRLILKKLTPELFTSLFQECSKADIMDLLGLADHDEFIREKFKAEGGYKTYDRTILAFLLISKASNETIGRCGYHNWYLEHHKAEIGYVLKKEENRRKGYMTEALDTVLKYGFNVMNLNRIEACIGPTNTASISLVEKFGFTPEGYLRQHFVREGEIQDTKVYSLLREEFEMGGD